MSNNKHLPRLLAGVSILLLFAPAARAGPIFSVTDSDRGVDSTGIFDIQSFSATSDGTTLALTLAFYGPITNPANPGGNHQYDIFGFIDLDADRNAGTGFSSGDLLASRGVGSLPSLGVDAYVDLSSVLTENAGYVDLIGSAATGGATTPIRISFTATSLTVLVPLTALGGSPDVNAGAIAIDATTNLNGPFVSDTASFVQDGISVSAVPGPAGLTLAGIGGLTAACYGWCRRGRARRGANGSRRSARNGGGDPGRLLSAP